MVTQDTWCTVDAYFKVKPDELEAFERLADRFVEKTRNESGIRYYGWSFDGYTSEIARRVDRSSKYRSN